MTRELYNHCQCDNCTGEDCGQDDPEEYEKEREKERVDIRQGGRDELLDDVPLKALKSVIGLAYSFSQLPEDVRNQVIEVDNFYHKVKELRRVNHD
jgi:hypothetical protein